MDPELDETKIKRLQLMCVNFTIRSNCFRAHYNMLALDVTQLTFLLWIKLNKKFLQQCNISFIN